MQQPSQQPPSQSAAPVVVQYTNAELNALIAKRTELKAQLDAITHHRGELSLQARPNAGSEREYQSRLRTLDERSARLENDILRTDDAIADAISRGVATTALPVTQTSTQPALAPGREALDVRDVALPVLAFAIAGVILWRLAWSRAAKKFSRPTSDQSGRFEQLQQSIDVIALEVERISESQRYLTKVLNESIHPSLSAGKAEPIQQAARSAAPVRAP